MAVSQKNGVDLTSVSELNGIPIATIAELNGQPLIGFILDRLASIILDRSGAALTER